MNILKRAEKNYVQSHNVQEILWQCLLCDAKTMQIQKHEHVIGTELIESSYCYAYASPFNKVVKFYNQECNNTKSYQSLPYSPNVLILYIP